MRQSERDHLETTVDQLRSELAATTQKLSYFEHMAKEDTAKLEAANARIAELERDRRENYEFAVRAERVAYKNGREGAEWKSRAEKAEAELADTNAALADAKARIAELEVEKVALREYWGLDDIETEFEAARARIAELETLTSELGAELAAKERECDPGGETRPDPMREALDNSQSLLVAMLIEQPWPLEEIEKQIAENRAALNPSPAGQERAEVVTPASAD